MIRGCSRSMAAWRNAASLCLTCPCAAVTAALTYFPRAAAAARLSGDLHVRPRRRDVGVGLEDLRVEVHHRDARVIQTCLRLAHSGFKNLRIDQCDQLSFGDLRIEVGVERLDIARYLAADLYRDHRVGCAGGRDGGVDISTLDARRAKFRRVADLEDSPSPQARDLDRPVYGDDQLLFC